MDVRNLATLHHIAAQAGRTEDPRAAASAILAALVTRFEATAGLVALVNPDTGALELEAQSGMPGAIDALSIRPSQGVTGWAAFHSRAVLVPDVAADPRYLPSRPATRCEMSCPLEMDGQVIGAVTLDADQVGAFGPDDLRQLVVFAAEAAPVLQRLWQLRHLQAKARQLETLTTVGLSLVAKLQLPDLLDTVTRETRAIMGSRLCLLYLHDAERGLLRLESWSGPAGWSPEEPRELPAHDCLAGTVIRTRKPAEFTNLRSGEFDDCTDVPRDPLLASVLLSPLTGETGPLGAIAVYSDHPRRHNDDEKRLLGALANLGAVAIENARLYARVFQSEEVLRKNETLVTLGLLAAEIAHEIRNPLTVIKLLFGSLGLSFPAGDPRAKDVRIIGEKLNQLDDIVARVLGVARAPASLHSRWALDEIVGETLLLVRHKLRQSQVRLEHQAAGGGTIVEANKGQLQQVLLNLILNSLHAMPQGGTLTLATRREAGAAGPVAVIEIADTGTGIPPEIRERIFDSFLSGRTDGTGLGLAIVKRILVGHRGDIELVHTGPSGTTMRVRIPAVA